MKKSKRDGERKGSKFKNMHFSTFLLFVSYFVVFCHRLRRGNLARIIIYVCVNTPIYEAMLVLVDGYIVPEFAVLHLFRLDVAINVISMYYRIHSCGKFKRNSRIKIFADRSVFVFLPVKKEIK